MICLSAWYRRARSKKHSGIRDTRVLKFNRLDRNHIFLRWHYPDQVQGFEKTILVSAGRFTSTPFQLYFNYTTRRICCQLRILT